jgi:hypothetical protein
MYASKQAHTTNYQFKSCIIYVYTGVRKQHLFPPFTKMIFFPLSHDTLFFDFYRVLFALILPYFASVLSFYFPFALVLSPFIPFSFLFLSFFFLFLLHFPPFSFPFYIFPQMTLADVFQYNLF